MQINGNFYTIVNSEQSVYQADLDKADLSNRFHGADQVDLANAQFRTDNKIAVGIDEEAHTVDTKDQVQYHSKAISHLTLKAKCPAQSFNVDLSLTGKILIDPHIKDYYFIAIFAYMSYVVIDVIKIIECVF